MFIGNKKENQQYSCGRIQSCTDFLSSATFSPRASAFIKQHTEVLSAREQSEALRRYVGDPLFLLTLF